jgi:hypothetical protein
LTDALARLVHRTRRAEPAVTPRLPTPFETLTALEPRTEPPPPAPLEPELEAAAPLPAPANAARPPPDLTAEPRTADTIDSFDARPAAAMTVPRLEFAPTGVAAPAPPPTPPPPVSPAAPSPPPAGRVEHSPQPAPIERHVAVEPIGGLDLGPPHPTLGPPDRRQAVLEPPATVFAADEGDDERPVEPVVHITIGRVEVRAEVSATAARRDRERPTVMPLEEYLEQRGR